LRRPVVEIGVFLFMKAQLSNRLTTKTERFDKAQSGDGLFLYFLGKLGLIANERHNARLAPRINGTVWPQSATQRVR
jgi:hypothetical protein